MLHACTCTRSEAQVQEFRQSFDEFDTDGSGTIETSELEVSSLESLHKHRLD
jgi:Ca2+-binding EF-hand superfamily protein